MEEVLDRARRVAEEAEVFSVEVEETPVVFEANRLKQLMTRQSRSLSLRLVHKGRTGFSNSSGVEDAGALVEQALQVAQFGAEARFHFPTSKAGTDVEIYDPAVKQVSLEDMVALGEGLIEGVRRGTADLVCEARVSRAVATVTIANTQGSRISYQRSYFGLGVEGLLVMGTDMLFVGDGLTSCRPTTDASAVITSVVRQLELSRKTAQAPNGLMPVVFTPMGVASAFFSPLAAGFNGRIVLQGASPLKDKVGESVFDGKLSLADDANQAYQPFSRPWDDEGVPTRRITLIERGAVDGFLYDLQTAGQAGTQSTGSAQRQGRGLPSPGVTAFVVAPGEATLEDMIADMKEGLVVEGLMGAEQGNVLGGDFSGNVLLGYRVENGQIVGRVKDTMVSGNIYQSLGEIEAVGREGRWVGGRLFTPPLFLRNLNVATKG
ncbi:MAG: TldD/PmbA family protein [Dehalococcoidia bacterium]|nr:TldD/PmbA family protein [Dehalococcoidia bacterium]